MYLLLVVICLSMAGRSDAQSTIESHSLEITYNKTSSIIFPAVIKSVDKGSRDVLAQKAKGVENVLQLKAARENFPETNLTVITADGAIHEFAIRFAKAPAQQVMTLAITPLSRCGEAGTVSANSGGEALIFQTDMTESDMERFSQAIIRAKKPLKPLREKQYKITLRLSSIHIKDNMIFFHLQLRNQSNIDYDVDFIRFFIRDQVKVKRTASQEVDVEPAYVFGEDKRVKGKSTQDIVYALGKFTIPDAKRLVIEMFEKNGGRNINLSIKNKTIVKAKLIE